MNYFEKMAAACVDELQKIASKQKVALGPGATKALALAALGAGAYHYGRKGLQDYKMGKQMRQQQGY